MSTKTLIKVICQGGPYACIESVFFLACKFYPDKEIAFTIFAKINCAHLMSLNIMLHSHGKFRLRIITAMIITTEEKKIDSYM